MHKFPRTAAPSSEIFAALMFLKTPLQVVSRSDVIFACGFALQNVEEAHGVEQEMVGSWGLEPQTSTVSRWRSNQLSYEPIIWLVYHERGDLRRD